MKIASRIKSTLMSIRVSIKRFPITVFVSSILAMSLIYLNESNISGNSKEILIKINLLLGLGIFLSFIIGLGLEKLKNKNKTIFLYFCGAVALALYYILFLDMLNEVLISRYISTILSMFLIILFIQKINRDKDYEYYLMDILSEIALTIIYSIVLYLGVSAILFTIDSLFDVNVHGDLYFYMFIIVVFVFAVSLFLSKFPKKDKEYKNTEYTSALRVLLTYIVIPLISIYTVILYVYFGKILLTREWPRGLVSHLVLWYSTVSVGVLFLISPILQKDKISSLFKKVFPKANLLVLIMMFMSIGKRVSQYGMTENRYYVVVLGIWVFAMMTYFSFRKSLKNIIIPITLSMVLLNSVYGPLSSFSISKYSQNKRFEEILNRNDMILNGEIISNEDISNEDKTEINNIISYFSSNHDLDDIKLLPDDFKTNDLEELVGFKYEPYNPYPYNENTYVYYGIDRFNNPIDIKGYEYYLELSSWNEKTIEVEEVKLDYNKNNDKLDLIIQDEEKVDIDIQQLAQDIYTKQSNNDVDRNSKDRNIPIDIMTYDKSIETEIKTLNIRIIFTNINGRLDSNDKLNVESIEFILLMNISDK